MRFEMGPTERYSSPESPKRKYAEDIFERLPKVEAGVDVPRVNVDQLSGGKDTRITLSAADRIGREGWDIKELEGARIGSMIRHRNGDVFEVTAVDNREGRVDIRSVEDSIMEGSIIVRPRVMNAHQYEYKISDQVGRSKKFKLYDTVLKDRGLRTTEFINTILKSIPAQCMDVFDEIQIHSQNTVSGVFKVEPSFTGGRGIINLYVSQDLSFHDGDYPTGEAIETLYHELGHAIAKYLKGSTNPGPKWRRVMGEDGNTISEYAEKTRYPKLNDHGEIEDIAETARLYFATDAAKNEKTKTLREFCRNRFAKFDGVMEDLAAWQNRSIMQKSLSKPIAKSL